MDDGEDSCDDDDEFVIEGDDSGAGGLGPCSLSSSLSSVLLGLPLKQ